MNNNNQGAHNRKLFIDNVHDAHHYKPGSKILIITHFEDINEFSVSSKSYSKINFVSLIFN